MQLNTQIIISIVERMNHRQVSLQNIIKQQQAKLSQLKEQLGLVTELSQARMLDLDKRHFEEMLEKSQIVTYLKEQLDKQRGLTRHEQALTRQNGQLKGKVGQLQLQQGQCKQECLKLQRSFKQLEARLKKTTQQSQAEINSLLKENKRLSYQANEVMGHERSLQLQIDKVTKFYKAAMFQIPKRKQTLLWVDNLIKFMQVSQANSQSKYSQMSGFIRNYLDQMRTQLLKSLSEVAILQQKIHVDNESLYEQLKSLLLENSQQQAQLLAELEDLNRLGKKQKQQSQRYELESLRSSLAELEQRSKQTQQNLRLRVKQLQTQKKSLVLGFQQIKTFLENKQANYRQEIASLKRTINDLLQAAQIRQQQFDEEIRTLSGQIQSISNRYYENIEMPLNRINEKVEREISRVKDEFMKLNRQNTFRSALEKLGQNLPSFTQKVGSQQVENGAIYLCLQKGNQLLGTISQLLLEIGERRLERKSIERSQGSYQSQQYSLNRGFRMQGVRDSMRRSMPLNQGIRESRRQPVPLNQANESRQGLSQNTAIPYYSTIQHQQQQLTEMRQLKQAVSQIQLKQRESKQLYEMNLLKRHNQKLNRHIESLERKIKTGPSSRHIDQKALANYFKTQRKLIDLQTQLQQATQINNSYQNILKEELEKIYKKLDLLNKYVKASRTQEIAILQATNQLKQRHDMLYDMVRIKGDKLDELLKSINIINNMLIRPAETFQNLVKQVAMVANLTNTRKNQNQLGSSAFCNQGNTSYRSRLSINQNVIKEYQQIISKRTQINNNGSKYITQLIKTLRQTFPIRDNKRKDIQGDNGSLMAQKQNALKGDRVKPKASAVNFEKKFKQIQAAQNKHKQEILVKLAKISEQITSIQNKKDKKQKLDSNKDKKIQQLLQKHFKAVLDQIKMDLDRQKRDYSGFSIQALKDTSGKLRQSIKENQGIKKEMQVLYLFSRKTGNKNDKLNQQA